MIDGWSRIVDNTESSHLGLFTFNTVAIHASPQPKIPESVTLESGLNRSLVLIRRDII
jgi:hypothetical protein